MKDVSATSASEIQRCSCSSQIVLGYLIVAQACSGMPAIAFLHSRIHPDRDRELGLGGEGGGDDVMSVVPGVGPDHDLPGGFGGPGGTDRSPMRRVAP